MFENLTGFVGDAIHADRLRQTATHVRRAEAKRVREQQREAAPHRSWRISVARVLVALAVQIAPTVTLPGPTTRTLAL
jgi:hypothetical protein